MTMLMKIISKQSRQTLTRVKTNAVDGRVKMPSVIHWNYTFVHSLNEFLINVTIYYEA